MGKLFEVWKDVIKSDNEARREYGDIEGGGYDKANEYKSSFVSECGGMFYKEYINGE